MKRIFVGTFLIGLFGYLTTRLWQEFVVTLRQTSWGR